MERDALKGFLWGGIAVCVVMLIAVLVTGGNRLWVGTAGMAMTGVVLCVHLWRYQ
jgi:hypothetical protein